MPVHTAYAVPNGSDRSASAINAKLSAIATKVATVGQNRVNPSEYFSPSAQPTSSRPAPRSASQAFTAFGASQEPSTRRHEICARREALHHAVHRSSPRKDVSTFSRLILQMIASSLRCSRDKHVTGQLIGRCRVDRLSQN
jgi:hypothetical protein